MNKKMLLLAGFLWACSLSADEVSQQVIENPAAETSDDATDRGGKHVKDWNFMVYIAGNNDLHTFAVRNIQQMVRVGSSDSLNILVQLDQYRKKTVNRYYVERSALNVVGSFSHNQLTTSGTKESLYEFVKWGVQNYPARHHAVVLWNHGSGIKDPSIWGRKIMLNRNSLFSINADTGLLELDREWLGEGDNDDDRGIAFNDAYKEYLTNQDLTDILGKISKNVLGNRKLDLLCMDACHMGMVEVGTQVRDHVDYMAASSEVEAGEGYDYVYVLQPFIKGATMAPDEFARHVVHAFNQSYRKISGDYTQSAVDLNLLRDLEHDMTILGNNLSRLADEDYTLFKSLIKGIRTNYRYTTQFCDTDYIDLGDFLRSLSLFITDKFPNSPSGSLIYSINRAAQLGFAHLKSSVLANAVGRNLSRATGLAIYFPKRSVDRSYPKTIFDQKTGWSNFLRKYVKVRSEERSAQAEEVSSSSTDETSA